MADHSGFKAIGDIDANNNKITNLPVPSDPTEPARSQELGDHTSATSAHGSDGAVIGANDMSAYAGTAVAQAHVQGTDQGLDTGGANAVTAAQTKTAFTHVGTLVGAHNASAIALAGPFSGNLSGYTQVEQMANVVDGFASLPSDSSGNVWLKTAPTTSGMALLCNTNGEFGVWTNITSAVNAGTPTNLFPGTAINNVIYIGGDSPYLSHLITVSTSIVIGGGTYSVQAWNGASWETMPYMNTKFSSAYTNYGVVLFGNTQTDALRYGGITSWATKSLNGTTKYWIRIILTGVITTSPQVTSIKLIGDTRVVHPDGVMELFGTARSLDSYINTIFSGNGVSGNAPGGFALNFGTGITLNIYSQSVNIQNNYSNGSVNGMVYQPSISDFIDTSLPVRFLWDYYCTVNVGVIEWEFNYFGAKNGDLMDGTHTSSWLNLIDTVPAIANTRKIAQVSIDMHANAPFQAFPVNFIRDARPGNVDDTAAGNAILINFRLLMSRWRV